MAIELETIATNRYAPAGASAINLYGDELSQGLTLSQLIQQVCLRTAAANESQSVIKMNRMSANSDILSEAADWLEKIASGSLTANTSTALEKWGEAKAFLVNRLGIPNSSLPANLWNDTNSSSFNKRMQVSKAVQDKMNALAQQQQQDMIDLQTMVNRRDVAYSTASNVVSALGQSMMQEAQNYL